MQALSDLWLSESDNTLLVSYTVSWVWVCYDEFATQVNMHRYICTPPSFAHTHPFNVLHSGEYHNISVLLNCWLVDYMQTTRMNA